MPRKVSRTFTSAPASNRTLIAIGIPVARRQHENRFSSVGAPLLDIGPALEELVDHLGVPVESGHREGCHTLTVCRFHVGASSNQQIRNLQVVPVHRPVKRGGAVHLGRIHVGFLLKQRSESRFVAFTHSVSNFAAGAADVRSGTQDQKRDKAMT